MKTRKNQEGQAIVEMTVGLIGMAAVFCGLILVANLTTSNIDNVLLSRGTADENGNSRTIGDQGDPILYWDAGPDQYQYSPDDVSIKGTSEDQADFLCEEKGTADFFEAAVTLGADPRSAALWQASALNRMWNSRK